MQRTIVSLACLLAAVAWLWASPALADGNIYVYQADNGSRLITDQPRVEAGYRLIKIYQQSDLWNQTMASPPAPLRPRPSIYDGLIDKTARKVNVDPLLIKSVMHAESGFDPHAVSSKGARGLMQLMPDTAERYGASHVFDPRENILAGARYLSDLLDRFNGSLELALASYNAGENAVTETGGIPPYNETRRYVKKVMHLYREYRNRRCRGRMDDAATIRGTILSCSTSSSGKMITQSKAPSDSGMLSADSRQWRTME